MDNPQLCKSSNNRLNETRVVRRVKQSQRGLRLEKQHGEDERVNVDRMKVSKLVQDKLEEYINYGKRLERFDPGGIYRTTPRMYAYDVTYKVLDHLDVGERHQSGHHQTSGSVNHTSLTPKYLTHSRQVTTKKEAKRLTKYAEQLLERFPIEKLNVIHRYRPNCPNVRRAVVNGDMSNYSCHFGAVLNTYSYIQYYITQGLHCGNPAQSIRLKKLHKAKSENKDKKLDKDFESGLHNQENIDTAVGRLTTDDQQPASEVTVLTDASVQTDKDKETEGTNRDRDVSPSFVTNATLSSDSSQAQETQTDT